MGTYVTGGEGRDTTLHKGNGDNGRMGRRMHLDELAQRHPLELVRQAHDTQHFQIDQKVLIVAGDRQTRIDSHLTRVAAGKIKKCATSVRMEECRADACPVCTTRTKVMTQPRHSPTRDTPRAMHWSTTTAATAATMSSGDTVDGLHPGV